MTKQNIPASERRESAAKRLRAIMTRRKINSNDIYKLTGVKPSVLSRILSENRDMKASTVVRLATGLGVTTDYLLGVCNGTLEDHQLDKLRRMVAQMDDILWAATMRKG
jgi:transcriptional regulator with XRE-family HTH domain